MHIKNSFLFPLLVITGTFLSWSIVQFLATSILLPITANALFLAC